MNLHFRRFWPALILTLAACFDTGSAKADTVSFAGGFDNDNDVRIFNFSLASAGQVTIYTTSYADGGFDPVLTLFDGSGNFITEVEDGTDLEVEPDPNTGQYFDAFFSDDLDAGNYFLALTQFDNFAAGGNLSDGFTGISTPGGFIDQFGNERRAVWAVTIEGVDSAAAVPEPATMVLLGTGLAGLVGAAKRRRRASNAKVESR